jgi:hypothetical protein
VRSFGSLNSGMMNEKTNVNPEIANANIEMKLVFNGIL